MSDNPSTTAGPGPTDAADAAGSRPEADRPVAGPLRYRVRRAPRFRAFLGTGAVLGLLVGVIVDRMGPASDRVQPASSLAFFAVVGAFLGALVAAVVAVLLDRRG